MKLKFEGFESLSMDDKSDFISDLEELLCKYNLYGLEEI